MTEDSANETPHIPQPPKSAKDVRGYLKSIEKSLLQGDKDSLQRASDTLDLLERWLEEKDPSAFPGWHDIATAAATARGHRERATGNPRGAIESYTRATELLRRIEVGKAEEDRRTANLLTYCGLALLDGKNWKSAAETFLRSIHLRERDPEDGERKSWGLSAAWINRGDAFAEHDTEEHLIESLRCFEIGADFLSGFDPGSNPSIATRLSLSHLKRAEIYTRLTLRYDRPFLRETMDAYDQASEALSSGVASAIPESLRMLAVVKTNQSRSRLLLVEGDDCLSKAAAEARSALSLLTDYSPDDLEMLSLELTARTTLCQAVARVPSFDRQKPDTEITNLVEEGLNRAQEAPKESLFSEKMDSLLGALFRCGAEAYLRSLPRFLADYLLEYLDPEKDRRAFDRSPSCHEAAVETLWKGISDWKREGFSQFGSVEFEEKMQIQEDWHSCRERLAKIRSTRFENP